MEEKVNLAQKCVSKVRWVTEAHIQLRTETCVGFYLEMAS